MSDDDFSHWDGCEDADAIDMALDDEVERVEAELAGVIEELKAALVESLSQRNPPGVLPLRLKSMDLRAEIAGRMEAFSTGHGYFEAPRRDWDGKTCPACGVDLRLYPPGYSPHVVAVCGSCGVKCSQPPRERRQP